MHYAFNYCIGSDNQDSRNLILLHVLLYYINLFAFKNLSLATSKYLFSQINTLLLILHLTALSTAARPAHLVISARLHLGSGVTTLEPAQPGHKQQAAAS